MPNVKLPKPIMMDPKKLKHHPKNVKLHDSKQLHDLGVLYEMIGFTDPIIADKKNVVWAGNGSLTAAIDQQMALVPVVYMPEEWTTKQKQMFMLMDNRITESEWNIEEFIPLFENVGPQLAETFEMDFVPIMDMAMKNKDWEQDKEEQPVPGASEDPVAKLGQIWRLGNHYLLCGDATKDIPKITAGIRPHLLFTDPPYGIDIVSKLEKGNQEGVIGRSGHVGFVAHTEETSVFHGIIHRRKYKEIIGDDKPFEPTFLLDKAKIIILFGANHYAAELPTSSHWLVWDKKAGAGHDHNTFSDVELMWTNQFKRKSAKIYRHLWSGLLRAGKRDVELKVRVHPTQKPVGMLAQIINDYTKEGDLVLDPYLGSGSTLIACEQLNRSCYGIELDPAYVDVIIKRWENFTGKKAELTAASKEEPHTKTTIKPGA